jgi:hypothetical protein
MTLIKLNDDRVMMGFGTFVSLSESIKPKETDYGTDGKNKEWSHSIPNHLFTLFSHKSDHHVLVTLHKKTGEFAFAIHRGKFSTDVVNHYNNERQNSDDAFTVFGKALHVGLEGMKKHNLKQVYVRGADPKLKEAYSAFVKNKFLQKHMANNGYGYSHSEDDRHYFRRNLT